MDSAQEKKPVAYSYVRYSTAKQELGDSLRRQVEMAEKYCAKHGLELHQDSYRDLGVSAFKRKNIEKGALASFIEAVKTGKVPPGSSLVVEQFDRLSRDDIDIAVRLLLELVHAGIRVVTLVDERVWDRESVKDMGNLILAIALMSRANNESATKAGRLRSKWTAKKDAAADGTAQRIVTSECPRWLKPTADKTGFEVLEDRVASIRKVFEARINGYGVSSIMSRANREKWPVPGKTDTWHTSLVGRLLKNRALLGEYQPHQNDADGSDRRTPVGDVIKGYYPTVLDEQTFLRAQATADRKGQFPGRRDANLKNWLQGLLRCSCGHSMVRKNKNSLTQPGYARYYCSVRNRGLSKCPSASAAELEAAVLHVVAFVAPSHFDGHQQAQKLKIELDVLAVELTAARSKRDRFAEAVGASSAPVKSLLSLFAPAEADVERLEAKERTLRAEAADIAEDTDEVFESITRRAGSLSSLDERAALREDLARVVHSVTVHEPAGYIDVRLRGDDDDVVQQVLRPGVQLPGDEGEPATVPTGTDDAWLDTTDARLPEVGPKPTL